MKMLKSVLLTGIVAMEMGLKKSSIKMHQFLSSHFTDMKMDNIFHHRLTTKKVKTDPYKQLVHFKLLVIM
jgi:hypothetical protein